MKNNPFYFGDQEMIFDFKKIKTDFNDTKIWGFFTSLDYIKRDPHIIRSAELIEHYIYEMCDLIEMKRFGDPVIVCFGEDSSVAGGFNDTTH